MGLSIRTFLLIITLAFLGANCGSMVSPDEFADLQKKDAALYGDPNSRGEYDAFGNYVGAGDSNGGYDSFGNWVGIGGSNNNSNDDNGSSGNNGNGTTDNSDKKQEDGSYSTCLGHMEGEVWCEANPNAPIQMVRDPECYGGVRYLMRTIETELKCTNGQGVPTGKECIKETKYDSEEISGGVVECKVMCKTYNGEPLEGLQYTYKSLSCSQYKGAEWTGTFKVRCYKAGYNLGEWRKVRERCYGEYDNCSTDGYGCNRISICSPSHPNYDPNHYSCREGGR
jgi:hypothetical protein